MRTNDTYPDPATDEVPTPTADDAVQGYDLMMRTVLNSAGFTWGRQAVPPVPFATGGATVGSQGGATTTHRMR